MVKKINIFMMMAIAAINLASCAEEKSETDRDIQERILNAVVETQFPEAKVWDSGLVVIDYQQGTGDTLDRYEGGFFEYSTQALSGNYAETTVEELAKELGTFANSNYYGPKLFQIGYQSTYAGLEEIMTGMQVGAKAKFILPPWLTYIDGVGSAASNGSGDWNVATSVIYEVELKEVITNILDWQIDTMKAYANTHYPGLDTLKSNFYFKKLHDAGGDTLENENVNVRYVGRLLDGWVFDTNIADTAKKYGIYDSSSEYEALSVQFAENLDTMVEDNSLVRGFCMALKEMSYGDKAFAMFYSEYGYSSSGSDQIGPYQPLIFWLYVEPDEIY